MKEQLDVMKLVLDENKRLSALLRLSLRGRARALQPVTQPPIVHDEPPVEVMAAIDNTFPGDTAIRSINLSYAYSQKHRWENEAREIADEIIKGRS